MDRSQVDAVAFEQGREAYKMGDSTMDNPYIDEDSKEVDEEKSKAWLEGFEYQKQIGQKHIG